jgi:hypothetical protein
MNMSAAGSPPRGHRASGAANLPALSAAFFSVANYCHRGNNCRRRCVFRTHRPLPRLIGGEVPQLITSQPRTECRSNVRTSDITSLPDLGIPTQRLAEWRDVGDEIVERTPLGIIATAATIQTARRKKFLPRWQEPQMVQAFVEVLASAET